MPFRLFAGGDAERSDTTELAADAVATLGDLLQNIDRDKSTQEGGLRNAPFSRPLLHRLDVFFV